MRVSHLNSGIGAEIVDLDLGAGLSDHDFAELDRWYKTSYLLLFRDQNLTEDQQRQFVSRFGPLDSRMTNGSAPGFYLTSQSASGRGELVFHSDFCFLDELLRGLSLYAQEVPPEGGSTIFLDAVKACGALPDELRRDLEGRQAVHVYDPRRRLGKDYVAEVPAGGFQATHPMIFPHPVSGAPVLYVNPWMTEGIVGVGEDFASDLLARVCAHLLSDPAFVYVHHWHKHDFLLWDNISLLHRRTDYNPVHPRRMFRLQLGLAG